MFFFGGVTFLVHPSRSKYHSLEISKRCCNSDMKQERRHGETPYYNTSVCEMRSMEWRSDNAVAATKLCINRKVHTLVLNNFVKYVATPTLSLGHTVNYTLYRRGGKPRLPLSRLNNDCEEVFSTQEFLNTQTSL